MFLAFTEVGRYHFPQLLDLPVESGYRARKPHSPIFWLLLIKAVSINRQWHICKVLSQCHVALGGSQSWEQGGSEPAATPSSKADRSCAATGVGCQGSDLAISYSFHSEYNMKKPHGYSWAPSKCLLKTHKHERLSGRQSNSLTAAF